MKTIKLKKLILNNFKGIKSLELDFENNNKVFGANAKGKTSIITSYIYLLTGKDIFGNTQFSIKPLNDKNEQLRKVDNVVEGIFDIDGQEMSIKRINHEKWVKQRGSLEAEFSGNEVQYFINNVPLQQKEFTQKINEIISDELFALLSNINYFSNLNWSVRRNMLIKLVGEVSDKDVILSKPEYQYLLDKLVGKDMEMLKKEISAKRKLLNDQLESIPTRIDEINKNNPEKADTESINIQINRRKDEISKIDTELLDSSKKYEKVNTENQNKQNQIFALKNQLQQIEFDEKQKQNANNNDSIIQIQTLEQSINSKHSSVLSINRTIESLTNEKTSKENQLKTLLSEHKKVQESKIDVNQSELTCSACKRPFEKEYLESKQAEIESNFNKDKVSKLKTIVDKGTELRKQISEIETQIGLQSEILNTAKRIIDENKAEIDKLKSQPKKEVKPIDIILKNNKLYLDTQKQIDELNKSIVIIERIDTSELIKAKNQLQLEIESLQKQLSVNEQIEKNEKRIEELNAQSKILSQEIATIEKTQDDIFNFEKYKIDLIEESINSKFKYAKFKMFKTLINGSIEPTCEIMYNGVNFGDLNNAMRINVQIDIINTFANEFGYSVPIMVDNAESSNYLIESHNQLIAFYVIQPIADENTAKMYESMGILLK